MACYELVLALPSTGHDLAWHYGTRSVWFLWTVTGQPHLARIDLDDGSSLDSFDPPVTTDHTIASHIAADDDGQVWWAERANLSSQPIGIRIHRYNPATDVDTEVVTLTEAAMPNGLNHDVTGLEWHNGRIWVSWLAVAALPIGKRWHVQSFLENGTDLTTHATGSDTVAPLADGASGPLIFDLDTVSLWLRYTNAGTPTIAHLDLRDDTLTIDPAGGTETASVPGPPTADGVLFSSAVDGVWRLLRFDDPGFTRSASACDDTVGIGAAAYDGSDSAFIDTDSFDLWARVLVTTRFHLGKVGFRA